jgi:hypothetical protein
MAAALEPVDPARPAFDLQPTRDPTTQHADPSASGGSDTMLPADPNASSATYHNKDQNQNSDSTNNTSAQEKSVVRAWLLAGAERWRKGGDARNKRLDVAKARAQAVQLKESVNRTEQFTRGGTGTNSSGRGGTGTNGRSGGSASGSGSGKSLGSKSGKGPGGSGSGGSSGGRSGNGSGRGTNGSHGSGGGSGKNGGGGRQDKATHRNGTGLGAAVRDRTADRVRNGPKPKDSTTGKHAEHAPAHRTGPGIRSAARDRVADRVRNGPKAKDSSGDRTGGGASRTDSKSGGAGGGHQNGHGSTHTGASGKTHRTDPGASGKKDRTSKGKSDDGHVTTQTCGPDSGLDKKNDKDYTAKDKKAKDEKDGASGNNSTAPAAGKPVDLTKTKDPAKQTTSAKPDTGKTAPDTRKTPTTQQPTDGQTTGGSGRPGDLQRTREAGYRDGTRIGAVVAHADAYKDGVKDGYRDTKQAADQEKARLDKARADRKTHRKPAPHGPKQQTQPKPIPPKPDQPPTVPPKPVDLTKKPATTTAAPAAKDQQKPEAKTTEPKPKDPPMTESEQATPIQVLGIDATHLDLGEGSARPTISRGDVRNLKQYERNMGEKASWLGRAADVIKAIHAEDIEEDKRIGRLKEMARAVKGGTDLIITIERLQAAINGQAYTADQLHKQAVRGAENTQTLLANVDTRYGGMYQAVVDSPLTIPAEMSFYKEGGDA